MSSRVVPGLSELVYSLICEHPGIFKHELFSQVNELPETKITESDLSDVISCLKLYRGVFIKRGYGYFRDEDTFSEYSFGLIPGKEVRKKWRQSANERNK
ncbi:hypothetical protein BZK42_27010 [Citrobacter braakii]|uniref:Uncharacterized protein n=1 Tax=Citrobacter braakii TaxID=57706 RepID=A0A1V8NRT3_CITBR|nr:hypothetical protein BZK42_27010 [Citrobacter braakii]